MLRYKRIYNTLVSLYIFKAIWRDWELYCYLICTIVCAPCNQSFIFFACLFLCCLLRENLVTLRSKGKCTCFAF